MGEKRYRRCTKCNTMNLNRDYCEQCGTLINVNLRRKLEREARATKKEEERKLEKPSATVLFFKKMREHPNLFIRILGKILYSVWVIVVAIGAFLAFIFSYLSV